MRKGIADNIALHFHVLHDEIGAINAVGHDASDECSGQNYGIRSGDIEELFHGILVR